MFHNIDILEDTNNIPLNFNKKYVLKNNKMVAVKMESRLFKNKLSNETVRIQYHKSIEEFQQSGTIIYKKFNKYDIRYRKFDYIIYQNWIPRDFLKIY